MCIGGMRVTREKPSPSDVVKREAFHYDDQTGILAIDFKLINIQLDEIPKLWIPSIPDTGSMDPVFDYGHNNLLLSGRNPADHQRIIDFIAQQPGNIAVYQPQNHIHRIIRVSQDELGRYFKFRGDNNLRDDTNKVRDGDINHVYVGTIP